MKTVDQPKSRVGFIDTNYANFLMTSKIEDQAEAHYLDAFFRDAYARSGQAANYKRIDIDTGETIIDLEGYKGERTRLYLRYILYQLLDFRLTMREGCL